MNHGVVASKKQLERMDGSFGLVGFSKWNKLGFDLWEA
jgi:hypothetical protein